MDMYRILENFDAVNRKQTLTEGQMKRSLEARAEQMSKADFVANAGEYGMSPEEAAEFWIAVNGGDDEELDEAQIWPAREGEKVSANGKPAVIVGQIPTQAGMAKYYAVRFDGKQYPGNTYDQVHANQISAAGVAEGDMEEGNEFSGELAKAKATGAKEFKVDGKTYPVKEASDEELDAQALAQRKRKMAMDKNTRAVQSQPAGAAKRMDVPAAVRKARGDAPLSRDELSEMFPGTPEYEKRFGKTTADMDSAFDKKKISTGTVYTRKYKDEPESDDDTPKKAGRPKGPAKGPERVTKAAWKHKGERKVKEDHSIDIEDRGEYDREGDMALNQVHQIADAARELHAILASDDNLPEWVQSKITKALDYIDTARDYLGAKDEQDLEAMGEANYSAKAARAGKDIGKPGKAFAKIAKDAGERYGSKERGEKVAGAVLAKLRAKEGVESVEEKAPPGAKAERMVKHIKKGYADDGKLTDREKAIAYATAWKAKKAGKVEEESTETKDQHAEKAGKRVAKDIEHDEGHKGKDDAKAEKAGKKVTKDIEYDDKKDKEEKVDETTVAGSVATAPAEAPKKGKGGMQFGKGVYEGQIAESFEKKLGSILTEGMSINTSIDVEGNKSVTVTATDTDADALGDLLKMAGMFSSEGYSQVCHHCGGIHEAGACGADMVEEGDLANSPDEVYADKDYMTQTLSGGLNGPKTTGQTTGPIVNRQDSRQGVMAEVDRVRESAESRLWSLYREIDKK